MNRIDLTGGMGCAGKIDLAKLRSVLPEIPRKPDENLLVGYDTLDDGAVYKIDEGTAIIQTLDFFTPMNEDPYLFGQIAAANAMSDVYAMGGEVLTALNIVCFPEKEKQEVLGEILRGGALKVREAGGCLVGGHSISDTSIKYGLSVCGTVHPARIFTNAGARPGDSLILTKPLGVGIINTANRVGEASREAARKAAVCMTTLNKYAMDILKKYDVHACTDVTGFGLAGHGIELACASGVTLEMDVRHMHFIKEAEEYAADFLVSGAGQKNRNNYADSIDFGALSFARAELLFDAQTSGGLLAALPEEDAEKALFELNTLEIKSAIIGKAIPKGEKAILFKGEHCHEDH